MRLATWNCCSRPLASKETAWRTIGADVLVVPECPRISRESENVRWFGDVEARGLAVVTSPAFEVIRLPEVEELPKYCIPVEIRGPTSFLLLAVWAKGGGPDRYVRGINKSVDACSKLLAAQPSVVMGDFNSNRKWDHLHPGERNHSALVQRLANLGLVSAYHSFHGEEAGQESRPTFFLYRKEERPDHIDYCFIPSEWKSRLRAVQIGAFESWRSLSDHVPLVCEIE